MSLSTHDLNFNEYSDQLAQALELSGYIANESLAVTLTMAIFLNKPLLIEGAAGVGKTSLAQALAQALETELIRLQCYEGLDSQQAMYEWNYPKQLLAIRMYESESEAVQANTSLDLYQAQFLLARPLLTALSSPSSAVLLIDEIDRADEAFEAFLLEFLAEFQITIPEYQTVRAQHKPLTILTANGTRELSDALRRRCLYYCLDYPERALEKRIIEKHLPNITHRLCAEIVDVVALLRNMPLRKSPGVSEMLEWAKILHQLGRQSILHDLDEIRNTLACLLKTREDLRYVLDEQWSDFIQAAQKV